MSAFTNFSLEGKIALVHSLKYDYYKFPGGGCKKNENHHATLIREVKEEIGLDVKESDINFVGTSPNIYKYKNITYKTCDIFFSCKCPADFDLKKLQIQESEVSSLDFYQINSEDDVEKLPIAFISSNVMLKKWLKSR